MGDLSELIWSGMSKPSNSERSDPLRAGDWDVAQTANPMKTILSDFEFREAIKAQVDRNHTGADKKPLVSHTGRPAWAGASVKK